MWFDLSRKEGFPTQYPSNATPVTVDVLEAGLVTAFVILAVSFLVSLPKSRLSTNVSLLFRTSVFLLIGLFLLIGNFGQEWETGHVISKMPYKAGTHEEIYAELSIKIGLRSVNVTLRNVSSLNPGLGSEIINYNERFSWTWDQGRFGFGPYAGHLQQEFRAAQYRGVPLPILWVLDYFVIDGEGFRFGRFYRTAGWYSHIILWCAFTSWLLSLILFKSVIRYGAYCLGTSGILQLLANLLWSVIRNQLPLSIPFENGTITTRFGSSYWLTFICGITCIALSIAIIIMDIVSDTLLYNFFGVDPLNSYDEVAYLTKGEQMQLRNKKATDIPLITMRGHGSDNEDEEYVKVYIKRRRSKQIPTAPPVIRSNKPKHLISEM